MMQPVTPVTQPASVFTIGQQGPPGVVVTFGGLSVFTPAAPPGALVAGGFYPLDLRTGPMALTMPPAVDGALVGLVDLYAFSAVNPVTLNAQGVGVTVADPSNRGSFSATVHVASALGPTVWWAFVSGPGTSVNRWIPVWW